MRAPFSGVLGLRRVSVGAYVQPSTVITTLDDIAKVKVDFTVPEAWLPQIQPGMTIVAQNIAWPGLLFRGEITTIDTRLDARTRAATFRAQVDNADHKLRPGMLLRLKIERGQDAVLQVPEEALIAAGSTHSVLRVQADGLARRVPVEIGRRQAGSVEITAGLEPGDQVVIEGIVPAADAIVKAKDGIPVRVVETRQLKN